MYIPAGSFIMGQSDEDITFSQIAQNKQVTVQAFYMDETEITNAEYRQFVNWVRDSIAQTKYVRDPKFFIQPKAGAAPGAVQYIDWEKLRRNNSALYGNTKNSSANRTKIEPMYYQGDDQIFGRKEIDIRLLTYHFAVMRLREAASSDSEPGKRRSDFIFRDTVTVYPDTLVWLKDFSYSQNEPMVQRYFSHPAFDDYPVVGVTWRQSRAFAVWRTRYYENWANSKKLPSNGGRSPYELPTEAQFEYAARGGRSGAIFPWGGPYIRNAKGCLMANFKPGRGNYVEDGGAFTVNVRSYLPNDFGLFNMAGNVAEWTNDAFDESSAQFVHDLNPSLAYEAQKNDPIVMKRKTIKGGSWKDVGYFLQNSSRTYEYQDTAKSYIGFRCVSVYPGRDINTKK